MNQEQVVKEVPIAQNIEVQKKVEAEKPAEENIEQINWRKFREQREIDRKQKEAAENRARQKEEEANALKAAMEAILTKPNSGNESNEDSPDETEDERIEKKISQKLAQKEKEYALQRQQREQDELPSKLKSAYSDFNEVVTQENLDYLEYHYPEVAGAFKHMPEGFEKWASVYKATKKFLPNQNSAKDKIKAEGNAKKPQSMAVPGVTQTGDTAPQMLDDKRKADNWARMQRVMKKV